MCVKVVGGRGRGRGGGEGDGLPFATASPLYDCRWCVSFVVKYFHCFASLVALLVASEVQPFQCRFDAENELFRYVFIAFNSPFLVHVL